MIRWCRKDLCYCRRETAEVDTEGIKSCFCSFLCKHWTCRAGTLRACVVLMSQDYETPAASVGKGEWLNREWRSWMPLVFAVVFCPCVLCNAIICLSALFSAHQSRVMMILFVLEMEWVLSTGQDKHFTWHCSESGQRLGGYRTSAGACGLQYPLLISQLFSCPFSLFS